MTERPLEEELRELVSGEHSKTDRPAVLHNQSGLNGLATNGVEGLDSVSLHLNKEEAVCHSLHFEYMILHLL